MILRTIVFLMTSCFGQIISLEENLIGCLQTDCSDFDQTLSYIYDSSILGDLTNKKFTLQFFIRINSQISNGFIALVQTDSQYLNISYISNNQIQIYNNSNPLTQQHQYDYTTNNWIAIYITQNNIIIKEFNKQQDFQHYQLFNSSTKINLFNNGQNYWQGQACCIIMYQDVNYMDNYKNILYNNKKPEAQLIINIQQEDTIQYTLFDHSEYSYIVRMGENLTIDQFDPFINKEYLQFSNFQYIYANDVKLNEQYTFEFRISLSTSLISNIILLNYSQPNFNILIFLNGTNVNFKQNDISQVFKLSKSTYYHFCIAVIQNQEESLNQYNINFYQFSDSGLLIKNVSKQSQFKIQSQGYGTLQLGSQENQFSSNQYFQLYHFRFYDGFFLDFTSSIDPNCSIYLNDRCIVCRNGLQLSDQHKCLSNCSSNLILTQISPTHNQCLRLCKATCATCSNTQPLICFACQGIRIEPPICFCPQGYFDDWVSPNCRKYLPDQTTQTGQQLLQCDSVKEQYQSVKFNYKYTLPPQVALFLIGVSQSSSDQEISLQIGTITQDDFLIYIKCSFEGQFYKIQWMSSLEDHLAYQQINQEQQIDASSIQIQRDQNNQYTSSYFLLQGWKYSTDNNNFMLNVTEANDDQFLIQTSSEIINFKYRVIKSNFLTQSYNQSQIMDNQNIQIPLNDLPKSIKFVHVLQGIKKLEKFGSFNLMINNRNSTQLQFKINQNLDYLQGFLLLAVNKCDPKEYCKFYDSYIKSCNLNYTLCSCNELSYYVNSTNYCDKCSSNCLECEGISTNCTQCQSNKYLEANKCMNCHQTCLTCSNFAISDCLTCEQKATLQSNKTCICNNGYYFDGSCQNCHLNCLTCTSGTDTSCKSCKQGKSLNEQNYCECPNGQYLNISDYNCYECYSLCLTCIDYMICTSCKDDKYLQGTLCLCRDTNFLNDQGVCQQCLFPCENCISPGDQCLSCPLNRHLENQQCRCNSGFFDDDGQCQRCMSICSECINDSSCTKCKGNRVMDQCQCQEGYYEQDNDCIKCPTQCLTCDYLQQCTSCKDTIELVNNQCKCLEGTYYELDKCLSCNTQLGLLQTVCNIINCSDGILSINEECDDGNKIENDGCTHCKIDLGYQCKNRLLQKSFCYKCQENCDQCRYFNSQINCQQCNHGYYLQDNSCLQCNPYCLQCTSQLFCTQCSIINTGPDQEGICPECEEGEQFLDGLCLSVCGDGILGKGEECDFGQQNDSGGCSIECKVQLGFNCEQNICYKIPEQIIDVQFVNSTSKTQILMMYNLKASDLFCNSFKIKIDNFTNSDFTVNYSIINDQCNFLFDYKKTITEQNLIRIKIPHNIQRLLFTETREIVIKPRKLIYYSKDQVKQAQDIKSTQDQLTFIFYFIGPTLSLIGGFQFFISLLDIFSWINNLYFINIYFPLNVQVIFQNTLWDNIQLFPQSFLPLYNTPSDPYYRESPPHFMERDMDPLFINNAFQTFAVWGLFLTSYIISKLIIFILSPKTKKKVRTIAKNLDKQQKIVESIKQPEIIEQKQNKFLQNILKTCKDFNDKVFSYFIKLLNLTYLDLFSAITLQLNCFDRSLNDTVLVNNVLAYLCLLLCIYLFYISLNVCDKNIILLKNKKFQCYYGTLYETIDINNEQALFYGFLNQIRKTAFIFTVVYFYNKPTLQTSLCCFISFINVGFIIYQNPFNSKKNLVQFGVPDICIFLLMAVFTVCAIDDQVSAFSEMTRFNIGWLIMSLILVSISVQLYFIILLIYQDIKNRVKSLHQKFKANLQ